jgi:hypothetical protein
LFNHSRRRLALGGTIAVLAAGALAGPAMAASAPGASGDTPAADMRKSGGEKPPYFAPVAVDPGGGGEASIIAI